MQISGLFFNQNDLKVERQQLIDEGRELTDLIEDQFEKLDQPNLEIDPSYQTRIQALQDQAAALPEREGYAYREPSDLEGILAERPAGARRYETELPEEALRDRLLAAWLGRCSGCLLGKPVEGWHSTTMWPYLKELDRYPLDDYFRSDVPDAVVQKYRISRERAYIDRVPHMVEDDDTNYTMTGLAIMDKHGPGFTPEHVAYFWLENLPILHTYTAERVAYRNLVSLVPPPLSASYRNPYREWIGAQIRADFWGYAAVGNPQLAAEFAWRDACISHIKNGIYGEMWVAAMLASAPFVETEHEVIEAGLAEIPAKSRLAEDIWHVLEWHQEGIDYEEAIRRVHLQWDETWGHHWCHTNSNAQIVALGLLWGEGDFEKSICRAVQACFDTDCNGATVGSIFGMMHGTSALPQKWIGPLNDGLETGISGFHFVRISEMAGKTYDLWRKVRT
jgi:hypothetical protein